MKIKILIVFLLSSVILSGLIIAVLIPVHNKEEISTLVYQNQVQVPESYTTASISKGTILLLLVVGVIGVLGVSRKKRDIGSNTQRKEASVTPDHQDLNENKHNPVAKNS